MSTMYLPIPYYIYVHKIIQSTICSHEHIIVTHDCILPMVIILLATCRKGTVEAYSVHVHVQCTMYMHMYMYASLGMEQRDIVSTS